MKNNIPEWLIVALWRALLGEIYPEIRAIAISYKNNVLLIVYHLERSPIEFDIESVDVVAFNVSALVGLNLIEKIEVECKHSTGILNSLEILDGFIFCRREY